MLNAFSSQTELMQGTGAWNMTNAYADNEADSFSALLGITYSDTLYDYSRGLFKNDNGMTGGKVLLSGVNDNPLDNFLSLYSNYNFSASTNGSYKNMSVYLVSDGGTTLSSINNPSLNANNTNAPSSVPLPATALLLGLGLAGLMRTKSKK